MVGKRVTQTLVLPQNFLFIFIFLEIHRDRFASPYIAASLIPLDSENCDFSRQPEVYPRIIIWLQNIVKVFTMFSLSYWKIINHLQQIF